MGFEMLALYKVKWGHTSNTYIVCHEYRDKEDIIDAVRSIDDRMDDIVDVELVKLPAFDGNDTAKTEFIGAFVSTPKIW